MSRYILSGDARRDIDKIIAHYRKLRQPDVGRKLVGMVRKACRLFAENAGLGDPQNDLLPGMRCGFTGRCLVFYQAVERGIQVLRVLHSHRDITAEMFEKISGSE